MKSKLVIPTILTATILIAGIFALMPIEKASTVHTTITANTAQPRNVALAAASTIGDAVAANQDTITITCNTDFAVLSVRIVSTHNDVLDNISVGTITNNGRTVTPDGAIPDPAANVDFNNDIGATTGIIGGAASTNVVIGIDRAAAGGVAAGDTLTTATSGTVLAPQSATCTLT